MKFFIDCTVLTTHTEDNPLVETFRIDKGLIANAGVFFPPGCHGRIYAKLFLAGHQILPRNQESWCRGNAGWWSEEAQIPVIDEPLVIKVVAWADGTLYDHTVTVEVEVVPFGTQPQWDTLTDFISKLEDELVM